MTVGEKEEKRWRESGEGGDGKDAPWFVRMARGPAWVGRGDRVGLDWMAGGHFAACLPLSSHFPLLPPLPTHVACPCAKGKKENERPSNTQPPILFDHTSGNESAREKWREGRGRKGRRGEKRPGEREKRGEREREKERAACVHARSLFLSLSPPLPRSHTTLFLLSLQNLFPFLLLSLYLCCVLEHVTPDEIPG